MPNADMNRLIDNARIRLPGAVDTSILIELFSVLDEFFKSSNIWQEEISLEVQPSTTNFFQDQTPYTHDVVPTQGSIVRLIGVYNGQGSPVPATMRVPGSIVIVPAPTSPETYTAVLSITVSDPVTRDGYPQFPDWVMERYGGELLDGLLGRMMSQIAKPYTSTAVATVHLRKFRQAIAAARVDARRQNVYRAQPWRFPGFAN